MIFNFFQYQTEDWPSAAIRDGCILAHDTGLGKSLAAFCIPLMKIGWDYTSIGIVIKKPVLIVAIGDLIRQLSKEGKDKLGIHVTHLNCANHFAALTKQTGKLPNGFYIISYQELTSDPRMEALLRDAFEMVVVDEGSKIKADDSDMGLAVRGLNPRYRLVLTATPIKNRLPDMFWLCAWVAFSKGDKGNAAFPFGATVREKDRFTETFVVMERNLTREMKSRQAGKFKPCVRATAEACNLPRLWKYTPGLIVRRRKQDAIKNMVKKIRHTVPVPMGKHQHQVYRSHLKWNYADENGRPAIGKRLMKLRQAAVSPESENLGVGEMRSRHDFTPKIATTISIINQCLRRGEQCLVFSPFNHTSDTVGKYLREAGVNHTILDGRETQAVRANKAEVFQDGKTLPVMLAGLGCMAYGYNFHRCNNVILTAYDWALDILIQAINRGHRANSLRDVNIYELIANGTVDLRMLNLLHEKEDSSDLVLDSEVGNERAGDLNDDDLAKILIEAATDFDREENLPVDEESLILEWPALKLQLSEAMEIWRNK